MFCNISTGQVITVLPSAGKILAEDGSVITTFDVQPITILDEFRAGGRVPLIIGKQLTEQARLALGLSSIEESGLFVNPDNPTPE